MNRTLLFLFLFVATWLQSFGAVTVTYDPSPDIPLDEIPERINLTLSPLTAPPAFVISSGTVTSDQQIAQGFNPLYLPISTVIKGELLEQVQKTNKFTITLTTNYGSGEQLEPVTYTLASTTPDYYVVKTDPDNSEELAEIPTMISVYLNKRLNASPTVTIRTDTEEQKLLGAYASGDHYVVILSLNKELRSSIETTGKFDLIVVTFDGMELPAVPFRVKPVSNDPITATYDPAPTTKLRALPATIAVELSRAVTGAPTFTISGPTFATKLTSTMGADRSHFNCTVAENIVGDLLKEIEAAGKFTFQLELYDGTKLDPVEYTLQNITVASYDPSPDQLLDELPDVLYFSLTEAMNGVSPTVRITAGEVSEVLNAMRNGSYQNFMVYLGWYASANFKAALATTNEFKLQVTLNDGTEVAPVTYKMRPPLTATYSPSPETELLSIPATVAITFSETLPAGTTPKVKIASLSHSTTVDAVATSDATVYNVNVADAMTEQMIEEIKATFTFSLEVTAGDKTLPAVKYNVTIDDRPIGPITLGYTTTDLAAPGNFLGETNRATTVGAAIRIPATKMSGLRGGKINGMRFATAPGLERVWAWIRPDLSSPALIMVSVGNSADGWNEVVFDEPYEITGDEIYIGYQGYQPKDIRAIRTETMTVANPDACWLGVSDVWQNKASEGWGNLMIQAFGEGAVSANDLMIASAAIDGIYYRAEETMKLSVTMANAGSEDASGFSLSYAIDNAAPVVNNIDETLAYEQSTTASYDIALSGLADGMHTLTVTISSDKEDENPTNNTRIFNFGTYEKSFDRTLLLEEFTTISCVNCPNGKKVLNAALADRTDAVMVAHHVGFGTDELTVAGSDALLDFDVPGAPSLMIDRTLIPSVDTSTPPFGIGYPNTAAGAAIVTAAMDYAAAIPAFAKAEVESEYDPETRSLNVTVDMERLAVLAHFAPQANISVFLTESDIHASRVQTGADDSYRHDHAVRAILTEPLGEAIDWTDNKASISFVTSINSKWVASKMEVVAVVSKPLDKSDVNNSQVLNTAAAKIYDPSDALATVGADGLILTLEAGSITASDPNAQVEVFDLQSRALTNEGLNPGFYVVKATLNGETLVAKCFVH